MLTTRTQAATSTDTSRHSESTFLTEIASVSCPYNDSERVESTMARRALAVVGKGMAGLAGASVLGVAGYAEYEPGFKRELAFWGRVVPPLAEYWWDYYRNDRAGYERLHEKYAPKALQGILDLGGMYIKFGQVNETCCVSRHIIVQCVCVRVVKV